MRRHKRQDGFTLIEVLVVVAIIALLVAILLPSLNRAREQTRATLCGSNMKQALNGVFLHVADSRMQKLESSTNFGWATYSLKQNKGVADVFACPSDEHPWPVAAVTDQLYRDGHDEGITTGCAVFSRTWREGSGWITDIQDQTSKNFSGGDAYDDSEGDILVEYAGKPGQYTVQGTVRKGGASWRHDLHTYDGKLIGRDVGAPVQARIPLIWMSYGANASAGLKNVKGNPILIAGAAKQGIFAEKVGNYPSDHLGWVLRFRHGGPAAEPQLGGVDWRRARLSNVPPRTGSTRSGWQDQGYTPRQQTNVGRLDGSVERVDYSKLMDVTTMTTTGRPKPRHQAWFGSRSSADILY